MAYFYKVNNKWSFRLDLGPDPVTGQRRQKSKSGFKTKKDALKAAAELETEIANNTYVNENAITFEKFAEEWLDLYALNVKPGSVRVRNHELGLLKTHLAKLKMQDITKRQYQKVLIDLKKNGYAENTISGVHGTARMIFKKAREFDIIKNDPTEFARPPRKQLTLEDVTSKVKYMEKDTLLNFLYISKTRGLLGDYAMFTALAYTGMRIGELCALTWQDIDFDEHTISITKTTYNPTNRSIEYQLLPPKTKKSIRIVDVDDIVLNALKKYKTEQNLEKMRYKNSWHEEYDFVFTAATHPGYPTVQKAVQSRMDRLMKFSGITTHFTPHSFRHTHTSLLAEADVPLHEIMDRLGHADDDTTRNVYLHVTKDKKKSASQKFAQLLKNASSTLHA